MEADLVKALTENTNLRKEAILKKLMEKTKLSEVDQFTIMFNKTHDHILTQIESLGTAETQNQADISEQITRINNEIQELQNLFVNATVFLRIYDRKIFQQLLQGLRSKVSYAESQLIPKRKFGFKVKKNNITGNVKCSENKSETDFGDNELPWKNVVRIVNVSDEQLTLSGKDIEKRDVFLKDLTNCCIRLNGNPTTLHAVNVDCCKMFFGPITTSVFLENVRNSAFHLACQQLRIHETVNTDFYVHVTSKPIIENCQSVRFGTYDFDYEGIEEDYESSGLDKNVNNWDKVNDFNWLVADKQSPNWSKIISN